MVKTEKERKRAQKQAKEDEQKNVTRTAQSIEDALANINENEFPTSMEDREKFCMDQLSTGEALFTQGNVSQNYIAFIIRFME